MPPNQTAAAAAHADRVIADAINMRILGAGDSPTDRAELATATATMPSEGYQWRRRHPTLLRHPRQLLRGQHLRMLDHLPPH